MKAKKIDELIRKYLMGKVTESRLERTSSCPSEAKLSDYLHNLLPKADMEKVSLHIAECLNCVEQLEQVQRAERSGEYASVSGPSEEAIRRAKDLGTKPASERLMRRFGERISFVCERCRGSNPPESKYCCRCGSPLRVLVCSSCNRVLIRGSRFCPYCGRSVVELSEKPSLKVRHAIFTRSLVGLKKGKWLIGALASFILSFCFPRFFLQFLALAIIFGGKWIMDSASFRTLVMIYDAWRKRGREEPEEDLKRLKRKDSR